MDDPAKKRFLLAVLLAWAPWVPTLIGLVNAFRGIAGAKATGVAAVAGGIAELLSTWGIVMIMISEVAAIVWLSRSFSRDHVSRTTVAVLSICASGLMLVIVSGCVYTLWLVARR